MKKIMRNALISCALMVPSAAMADRQLATNVDAFRGSDTLNTVMDLLLSNPAVVLNGTAGGGIGRYDGPGSTQGEVAMEGDAASCIITDSQGCQEISPMSRAMDHSICNDAESDKAEGMRVCGDSLVVVTDNVAAADYMLNGGCGSPFTSNFPGGPAGAYENANDNAPHMRNWKDTLRMVYTGCGPEAVDGLCASTVPRRQRCGSTTRRNLLSNWGNIQDGTKCSAANLGCEVDSTPADGVDDTGLRRAFRRDDVSGTTGVFLDFIGVARNLTSRTGVCGTGALSCNPTAPFASRTNIQPIPETFAFCDGGQLENAYPDCHPDPVNPALAVVIPLGGDPIRKDCRASEDVCGPDGKYGVVTPIRSTAQGPAVAPAKVGALFNYPGGYPTAQCNRGVFERRPFLACSGAPAPTCPDGTAPTPFGCRLPRYLNGPQNFDCIHPQTGVTGVDARTFNKVFRSANGTVHNFAANYPEVATWRTEMVNIDTTFSGLANGRAYVVADEASAPAGTNGRGHYTCTFDDATKQIGCMVGHTQCTIGYAGGQAANLISDAAINNATPPTYVRPALHPDNEAFAFDGVFPLVEPYAMDRPLFVNAIGGFDDMSIDCAARVAAGDTTAAWCADQLTIARQFETHMNALNGAGNPFTTNVGLACSGAGYAVRPLPGTGAANPYCDGTTTTTVGSTPGAPCGRATGVATCDVP